MNETVYTSLVANFCFLGLNLLLFRQGLIGVAHLYKLHFLRKIFYTFYCADHPCKDPSTSFRLGRRVAQEDTVFLSYS